MLPPLPSFGFCVHSVSCTLGMTIGTGIPCLVLGLAMLSALGVGPPDSLKEFVLHDEPPGVIASEGRAGTGIESHSGELTEYTPLLPPGSRGPNVAARPKTWRQGVLTVFAILHIPAGIAYSLNNDIQLGWRIFTASVFVGSWTYAALRVNIRPSCTPYYDILSLCVAQLSSALLYIYECYRLTGFRETEYHFVWLVAQLLWSIVGIACIATMPLSIPGTLKDSQGVTSAPEDNCTLWQWMTFTWISPLVALGSTQILEEKDLWELGSTMRSSVLMGKFFGLRHPSLLRRLFSANSKDIILDCSLTLLVTLMNFSGPLFLNLILRAIMSDSEPAESYHILSKPVSSNLHFYALAVLNSPALPPMIHKLVPPINQSSRRLDRGDAYFFAFALCICRLIMAEANLQGLYFSRRATIRIDTELKASIYEKILRHKDVTGTTSAQSKDNKGDGSQKSSAGEASRIITLISADVHRLSITFSQGQYVYQAIFSIFIASAMLYNLMGWTAFTGYVIFLLTLPFDIVIGNNLTHLHRMEFAMRDQRIQAVNEAIQAIKLIKYSGWESRWISRVLAVRQRELGWLRKLKIGYIFSRMIWQAVPVLVLACSFVFFALLSGREVTVDIAFPCIAVFGILSPSLTSVPMIVGWAKQCLLALKRIDKYLSEPDVSELVSGLKRPVNSPRTTVDPRIGCANATFRWPVASADSSDTYISPAQTKKTPPRKGWNPLRIILGRTSTPVEESSAEDVSADEQSEELPFVLKDISIIFPESSISLVYGPTGSGKSALLAALLGEMDCIHGEIYLPKEPTRLHDKTGLPLSISYCAQQPWLEHKSIKDNILFGSLYDQERYEATLACCALLPDLAILPDRDETEIGEKGVSLSGGQKARVALARAVYGRTQVVLLDDILSAVDTHTAEHIINQCLLGPLMQQRTVVLVTHHVDLVLPFVAWAVKLRRGHVEHQGTVQHLRETGKISASREAGKVGPGPKATEEPLDKEEGQPRQSTGKLVEDEQKYSGMVRPEVYKTYLSAASYWSFGFLVACLVIDQLVQLIEKLWLKYWSESYAMEHPDSVTEKYRAYFDFPPASQNVLPYLLVFVCIEGAIAAIATVNQIPKTFASLRASRVLFDKVLRSVMQSPGRFFDRTPSGRILNRFGKDIDVIDGEIQESLHIFVKQVAVLSVSVATVIYVFPLFGLFAAVTAYFYIWFASSYTNTARDLRRIESTARSPVISSFGEVTSGIATIRAFSSERLFLETLFSRLDTAQAASYNYWMCSRWLIFRFDALNAISVLVAAVGALAAGADAGLAGIVIVQAQRLAQSIHWTISEWTNLEQSFNSVERIHEYLALPSEPPAIINSNRPPASWPSPSTGKLVVNNLVIKYAPELEPVLHGISCEIKPSEKIGIVGRTGSGKSTLALSLLRFVDPTSGTIVIDGIDVTTIGLDDLRSRVTLIPQDATLFNGTIRDNLDPFNDYTDAECIESLRRVYLNSESPNNPGTGQIQPEDPANNDSIGSSSSTTVAFETRAAEYPQDLGRNITFTLDTKVSDGGGNFSHGQRQLISLARALLRKSGVILMDESTASVDFDTDEKIQYTIRNEFKETILLTIAHRLRTVMDNDRILVLDAGRVVEFDTPKNLLSKPGGVFNEMCKRSGHYDELVNKVSKGN